MTSRVPDNKIELGHLEHSWKEELEITAEAKLNPNLIPPKEAMSAESGFKSRKKKKAKMRDRNQLSFDDE